MTFKACTDSARPDPDAAERARLVAEWIAKHGPVPLVEGQTARPELYNSQISKDSCKRGGIKGGYAKKKRQEWKDGKN